MIIVGRVNELPIVFIFKSDNINEIENCLKQNLKQYQLKHQTELFKIDLEFIKETINYCSKKGAIMVKGNKKLLNIPDKKNWLIIVDKNNGGQRINNHLNYD